MESSLHPEKSLNSAHSHLWSAGYLDPHLVIRFPQVRKTFELEELRSLAEDIAFNDLLQPPMVTKLSEDRFKSYLQAFEKISKVELGASNYPYQMDDEKQKWFYVLIAGERRYRAHMLLWTEGCQDCRKAAESQGRTLCEGECFRTHFSKGMEVRVGLNIEPVKAKGIQFRENRHVLPPAYEEAYALRDYYDFLSLFEDKLSIASFARAVGCSAEKARKAIWFCELPQRLREAVEKKMISYGNALELKKILYEQNSIPEDRKLYVLNSEIDYLLINPRIKNEDYKKRVDSIIGSFRQGKCGFKSTLERNKVRLPVWCI